MHRKPIIVVVAALTLGVVGCGSGAALTRAELSKRANAICTRDTAQVAALKKRYYGRDLHALFVHAIPVETRMVADLRGLKPPTSAKAAYGRYVAIQQFYLTQLKQGLAGAKVNNDTPAGHIRIHEVVQITAQLGFNACK